MPYQGRSSFFSIKYRDLSGETIGFWLRTQRSQQMSNEQKPWLVVWYRGLYYPHIWGLFHKPWNKDPVLKQPVFHGMSFQGLVHVALLWLQPLTTYLGLWGPERCLCLLRNLHKILTVSWVNCKVSRRWKKNAETKILSKNSEGDSCLFVFHIYMAAAQNVRSGSSPGPTNDPDLWSRPPIQTFPRELIQTFGMIEYMGELMSAVIHPAKQATNCCKATLPSFQAVKLHLL